VPYDMGEKSPVPCIAVTIRTPASNDRGVNLERWETLNHQPSQRLVAGNIRRPRMSELEPANKPLGEPKVSKIKTCFQALRT
jgi:hypothetical protein